MKRMACILGLAFLTVHLCAQESGSIDGRVVDRDTKQDIIGAHISVVGTDKGAVTDLNGNFLITGLAPGTYRVRITAAEYKPLLRSDIRISSSQSTKLTLEMKLDDYAQIEVVVSGFQAFERSEDMRVSSNRLTQEEIRRAPGAVEDVSRMMQIMPGVAFGSDARNDIIARGGSPVENLMMIDGIEVPNINHYSQQGASGGPIGMINPDFLSDVNFSAGGFGAKYGDRLSSVMDIRFRDGDRRHLHGKFDLGLGGFGGIVEGPLQDEKSSFILSLRRSYLDLVAGGTGLTGVPNYWNVNFKATYQLSPHHTLGLLGIGGVDDIEFKDYQSDAAQAVSNNDSKFSGWRFIVGLSHRWTLSTKAYLQTSLSTNAYSNRFFNDSVGLNSNGDIIARQRDFSNTSLDREVLVLRSDVSYRVTPTQLLEVGLIGRAISNSNTIFSRAGLDAAGNNPVVNINTEVNALKLGAYSQLTQTLGESFSLTAGLRWDYFDFIASSHAFSPRLSASYELSEAWRINVAGGIYQQAPALIWLVADPRNRDALWMKTYHTVAGLEFLPTEDLKLSVEVFSKDYRDYPHSVANPEYVYSNAGADFNVPFDAITSGSDGYARGIEFFMHKKLTDRFYGMLSYSFSSIMFTDGTGVQRPSGFDYRHLITALGGYKITEALEISAKVRYAGGRPFTPFDLIRSQEANRGIFDFSRMNGERFNAYRRLDIRLDYRYAVFGWNSLFFIDLQNVLNVENVEQVVWNSKRNEPDQLLQWQFLPIAGLRIEF